MKLLKITQQLLKEESEQGKIKYFDVRTENDDIVVTYKLEKELSTDISDAVSIYVDNISDIERKISKKLNATASLSETSSDEMYFDFIISNNEDNLTEDDIKKKLRGDSLIAVVEINLNEENKLNEEIDFSKLQKAIKKELNLKSVYDSSKSINGITRIYSGNKEIANISHKGRITVKNNSLRPNLKNTLQKIVNNLK